MRWCLLMLFFPLPAVAADPVIVGYFTEWGVYDHHFQIADIPAAKLTHLNYAFAKVEKGEVAVTDKFAALEKIDPRDKEAKGNFQQLRQLKKKHPHLKTLISVGGWTLSGSFSDTALTAESRATFAASCVRFIREHGFDGADIDWEFPVAGGLAGNKNRPEDKKNYTLLLAELRKQLDVAAKTDNTKYLLTIAAPSGSDTIAHMDIPAMAEHLDWFNLMAYDLAGGWDTQTGLLANLYPVGDYKRSVAGAVQAYLKAGVAPEKIVLGVPFYGRGWTVAKPSANGFGEKVDPKQPKGTWELGMWDYKDLTKNVIPKGKVFRAEKGKAPWLYNADSRLFISYDDTDSMKEKVGYVTAQKLRGMMCWELSGDDPANSLLEVISAGLGKK
ncbi:glycoside hydrolase family 18 protein [Zavarzinella formosa]|uniref:glycoside hydrolase family 18 protein n=1 Tax=Zavarzinella formosa TaxID=360055 RepID=UPI000312FB61|nr:glycoside hydrolase family 18 protein [Zavarzinella formosa]